jgi:4-carboxymuconolactone decarboxylase
MSRVELAALVARDGRLLLFRATGQQQWRLPGGALAPGDDDADATMDALLESIGIRAPAVEDDFLQTAYLPGEAGHVVLNLYGPSEWEGDPRAPEGHESGWFGLDEIALIEMDVDVRQAVLAVFGSGAEEAESELAARLQQAMSHEEAPLKENAQRLERRAAGLDVLRTISATDPAFAASRMEGAMPELAGDVIDFALGEVWSTAALDRKTRSLQTVAMISALGGRAGALRGHINGALNHGASPEQVVETLRMVAVYAGFPAALEAWPVMEAVFKDRGIPRPGRAP